MFDDGNFTPPLGAWGGKLINLTAPKSPEGDLKLQLFCYFFDICDTFFILVMLV